MKNFTFATLAVVILTMLAATSAQAQSGYGGSGFGNYSSYYGAPSSNLYLPASYPTHSNSYGSSNCPNGGCPATPNYNNFGTSAGYPGTYGNNYGYGTGLNSWLGLQPTSYSTYSNSPYGQCSTYSRPAQYPSSPSYYPSPYGTTNHYGSYPGGGVNAPYYSNY